jgi:hypothetical protein
LQLRFLELPLGLLIEREHCREGILNEPLQGRVEASSSEDDCRPELILLIHHEPTANIAAFGLSALAQNF